MFIGNSLPVRQLDSWSGARSRHIRIFGNRGASGIDGNLSTLAGLNSAGIPTLGLLGDLALFHDLSGLLLAQHLRLPLVVINNGGGRIFDYLPQHGLPGFETLWRTPVALDMRRLAELFGIAYGLATDTEGLREAIDEQMGVSHAGLIEVRVDAELSRELHRDFWQLVGRESIIPI
jgi:2-succinyl-5-enolpyruvyl-6-hydroxy-3-cyclohexene-1-carboxylate synthase